MLNTHDIKTKQLYQLIHEALNDRNNLFSKLFRVEDLIYFNERTLQIINEESINFKKDTGYLIQLNTKGVRDIINIYPQKNKRITEEGNFNEAVFSFSTKEEIIQTLIELEMISTNAILNPRKTEIYSQRIKIDFELIQHLSIRFIYTFLNQSGFRINSINENEDKLFSEKWYDFIIGSDIFEQVPNYAYNLLNKLLQSPGCRIDQLKNNGFCDLLIKIYKHRNNESFSAITIYMYQLIKKITLNKDISLLGNICERKNSDQFLIEIMNNVSYTFNKSVNNKMWFYNEVQKMINIELSFKIELFNQMKIDTQISTNPNISVYLSLKNIYHFFDFNNIEDYLSDLENNITHAFVYKNEYIALEKFIDSQIQLNISQEDVSYSLNLLNKLNDVLKKLINSKNIQIVDYN